MIGSEIKSMVAQNCHGYEARFPASMLSMGSRAESCDSCINFVRGRCKKKLFDKIRDTITTN